MVSKGLRQGDIFKDGKREYKVLSVNADGSYISTTQFTKTEPSKKNEKTSSKVETKNEK